MRRKLFNILIAFIFTYLPGDNLFSQVTDGLVQFSGLVMTSDSLLGLPYVNIAIRNTHKGTMSNFDGFFSFVAEAGDTVLFSSVGYKRKNIIIPDTLDGSRYSVIQLMTRDTIHLPETIIYPWPTKDQFKEAFLNVDVPDDDLDRARKNLERERLKELGESLPADGKESASLVMRDYSNQFYTYGQYPYYSIFNPISWAKFIQAWKRGDFKKKK